MRICLSIITGFLFISALGSQTYAQPAASSSSSQKAQAATCKAEINKEFQKELLTFRGVVYGQIDQADAPIGSVRRAFDGKSWYKTGQWKTGIAADSPRGSVEFIEDPQKRRGILEQKGKVTSDLIPEIGQSLHALTCRLNIICDAVGKSEGQEDDTNPADITVSWYGCLEQERESIVACHFASSDATSVDQTNLVSYCRAATERILEQEAEFTVAAVKYHAAYVSLLQLSGNIDAFVQELQWPVMTTLRDTVRLLGSFERIPCFSPLCDSSPKPASSSPSIP